MILRKTEEQRAFKNAGFRERYAMEHGKKEVKIINKHRCIKYTYSNEKEYQDANGATYDTVTNNWIN